MEFKVNLTLEEIYKACCPKCKERILDLAEQNAKIGDLRDQLKQQFEGKKK